MAFTKVAEASQIATGQGATVAVGGREYALFNVEGEFFCIDNECPHHEGPLGDGELEGDVVYCPWHAWQVNVKTGEVAYMPSVCVATHSCKIEGDAVLIDV